MNTQRPMSRQRAIGDSDRSVDCAPDFPVMVT